MIVVNELNIGGVILTNKQKGIEMEFYRQVRPCRQDRPITIKVGFLSESAS